MGIFIIEKEYQCICCSGLTGIW